MVVVVWYLDSTTCAISAYYSNVVSSNTTQARCTRYNHYVIKFVSDLNWDRSVVFLQVPRFPPTIKLSYNITEILLKVTLNTINQIKPINDWS